MTDDPTAWLDATLAAAGRHRTGPVTLDRDRPWGTVWTAPTDAGAVWLKRPGPTLRYEIALLTTLAGLAPRRTPEVLGVTDDLVLLADAGRMYRDLHDAADRPAALAGVVAEVGDLQRQAAPLVPGLLAAGVADQRPAALVDTFDELVDALGPVDGAADARRTLVDVVADLGSSAVAPSVDHNDLHDGNVARDGAGRSVVLDWGDAVVAHPFATLLVPSRVLAGFVDADPDAPWAVPVVAAARARYLAGFADDAPGEDLERTALLAFRAAHVTRAWVWRRAMTTFDPTAVIGDRTAAEFAEGARDWLGLAVRVLSDKPVVGGQ